MKFKIFLISQNLEKYWYESSFSILAYFQFYNVSESHVFEFQNHYAALK